MLADDAAVQQLVCSPHGVLDCMEPNRTIHVSASTISPALVHGLADSHRDRNVRFLSATVLGRPAAAEQGKLFVLAAGERETIDQLAPVFEALASRTFVVGTAPEASNLIKLACNTLIATMIEAIGETYALIAKSGVVDPVTFVDVLLSTVLATPLFRPYGEQLLSEEFEPGFPIPLALKDIELALGAGRQNTVPMPLASLLRDHMIEAIAVGYGDRDWSALALVAQHEAGITARVGESGR